MTDKSANLLSNGEAWKRMGKLICHPEPLKLTAKKAAASLSASQKIVTWSLIQSKGRWHKNGNQQTLIENVEKQDVITADLQ